MALDVAVAPAFANDTKYSLPESKAKKQSYRYSGAQPFQFPNFQALLFGEISDQLTLVRPIEINIEVDEDQSYIVSDEVFLVYGHGDDRSEALRDYVTSLIEFYTILEHSLNPFDKKAFVHLQSYIQQRGTTDGIQTDRS